MVMARGIVVGMLALVTLSYLVAVCPEPVHKDHKAPKAPCTHVLAPGESC